MRNIAHYLLFEGACYIYAAVALIGKALHCGGATLCLYEVVSELLSAISLQVVAGREERRALGVGYGIAYKTKLFHISLICGILHSGAGAGPRSRALLRRRRH